MPMSVVMTTGRGSPACAEAEGMGDGVTAGGGTGGRDERDRGKGGEVTDGACHGRSVARPRYGTVTPGGGP